MPSLDEITSRRAEAVPACRCRDLMRKRNIADRGHAELDLAQQAARVSRAIEDLDPAGSALLSLAYRHELSDEAIASHVAAPASRVRQLREEQLDGSAHERDRLAHDVDRRSPGRLVPRRGAGPEGGRTRRGRSSPSTPGRAAEGLPCLPHSLGLITLLAAAVVVATFLSPGDRPDVPAARSPGASPVSPGSDTTANAEEPGSRSGGEGSGSAATGGLGPFSGLLGGPFRASRSAPM